MAKSGGATTGVKMLAGFLVYSLTTLVVLGAIGFWWAAKSFEAPGPLAETKIILIEKGAGLNTIAATLSQNGAIENPYIFVMGARVLNAQGDLKAGEYEIAAHASARAILEKMRKGEVFARRVIVPEGRTSFEIVEILRNRADLSGEIATLPPEGSLLPGSYDYQNAEPRERIIGRMQQAMKDRLAALWSARVQDLPLQTPEEALTLASIVEKETGVPAERARIAGVFINRLKAGMPLQSDPTVIYALNKGENKNEGEGPLGRRLLSKDLETDSPYNTYKNAGLPPGPIASPGGEALEAVMHPEVHEFLYFVADGTGGHVFAKTLAEHNANAAKWRSIRKEGAAAP
jgi:UPF0755 protein